MVSAKDVGWGSYKDYEGPVFWGKCPLSITSNPTDAEKTIAVITATEGGKFDAINMYDRMILSVGLIQYGEAGQYSVSDMLGAVSEKDEGLLNPMNEILEALAVTFIPNARNRWRFFLRGTEEVDTLAEQQHLFLKCDGHVGSWGRPDDPKRAWAKQWAACVANVFQQPLAQQAQMEYIVPRLRGFAMPNARALLWGSDAPTDTMGWPAALRAAYTSFAANIPAVAGEQLKLALNGMPSGVRPWSQDWVVAILKQLTFGPGIAIYPDRYNKIRPVLEAQYGVDLPDFAAELKAWQAQMGITSVEVPSFTSVQQIQEELLALGYDLGPAGADGRMGPKTKDAIMTFQRLYRPDTLVPDGVVGPKTRAALAKSWVARHLPAGGSSALGSSALGASGSTSALGASSIASSTGSALGALGAVLGALDVLEGVGSALGGVYPSRRARRCSRLPPGIPAGGGPPPSVWMCSSRRASW